MLTHDWPFAALCVESRAKDTAPRNSSQAESKAVLNTKCLLFLKSIIRASFVGLHSTFQADGRHEIWFSTLLSAIGRLQYRCIYNQASSVCRWLKIHQDYFCRIYFSQLHTFLLNDALQINAVASEMSPNWTGQTPLTTIGEIIYLFSEEMSEHLNWLQESCLPFWFWKLFLVACLQLHGLVSWALPRTQIVIYYLNTSWERETLKIPQCSPLKIKIH